MSLIARFKNDESGATAIEYGLLAALISVLVAAGGATDVGTALGTIFNNVGTVLSSM
ncbi:MAG: Flp family type IVb pilin [Hyphomicrobiaceae bacterium]